MAFEITPTMLRLSMGIPTAGIGGLMGYLTAPKEHRFEGTARGAGLGYMTGVGMGVGTHLGDAVAPDNKIPGMLAGGILGGTLGLGVGKMMQGEPAWEIRRRFREELLSLLHEEAGKLKQPQPLQKLSTYDEKEKEPALTRLAREHPELAVAPLSALTGGILAEDTGHPLADTFRGTATGGLTGLGALAGGTIGSKFTSDPMTGTVAGGGLGGLVSYIMARRAMRNIGGRQKEKRGAGPVIQGLLEAKRLSDRRDYRGKHQKLRELIEKYPDDFYIDSQQGNMVGITHKSGFQIHAPLKILPVKLRGFSNAEDSLA